MVWYLRQAVPLAVGNLYRTWLFYPSFSVGGGGVGRYPKSILLPSLEGGDEGGVGVGVGVDGGGDLGSFSDDTIASL